eukprot:GHUV01022755.1.p1 GENE.GHUV01022755.1~~GHUV01022755.1.p1  ORF type:complete len:203 (+),score=44.43 GHUV01022755.1:693-1301(+)
MAGTVMQATSCLDSVHVPSNIMRSLSLLPSLPYPSCHDSTIAPCCICSRQPTFEIDPAALEKRYKLLQWQLHPDKQAQKPLQEQEYSAEQASLINQAYGVLRSPMSRANYMLMLQGMTEEEREGTIADPELLMEVMEARELVDQEDDQERLVELHSSNQKRQAALCAELSEAFRRGDQEAAKQLVAQLSYWVRLEEAICEKL